MVTACSSSSLRDRQVTSFSQSRRNFLQVFSRKWSAEVRLQSINIHSQNRSHQKIQNPAEIGICTTQRTSTATQSGQSLNALSKAAMEKDMDSELPYSDSWLEMLTTAACSSARRSRTSLDRNNRACKLRSSKASKEMRIVLVQHHPDNSPFNVIFCRKQHVFSVQQAHVQRRVNLKRSNINFSHFLHCHVEKTHFPKRFQMVVVARRLSLLPPPSLPNPLHCTRANLVDVLAIRPSDGMKNININFFGRLCVLHQSSLYFQPTSPVMFLFRTS